MRIFAAALILAILAIAAMLPIVITICQRCCP
jgi:hypothetical protein